MRSPVAYQVAFRSQYRGAVSAPEMKDVWGWVVAVLGAVGAATLSYLFGVKKLRAERRVDSAVALKQERRAAYQRLWEVLSEADGEFRDFGTTRLDPLEIIRKANIAMAPLRLRLDDEDANAFQLILAKGGHAAAEIRAAGDVSNPANRAFAATMDPPQLPPQVLAYIVAVAELRQKLAREVNAP